MLIAFAIFGISIAVGLVTLVLYLSPGFFGGRDTSIPGPVVTDSSEGHLLEIAKEEGSLHRYLTRLHRQHGNAVAVYFGKQLVVSLGAYDLVLEHAKAFDGAPGRLFQLLEPLVPLHLTNPTGTITSSKGSDPRVDFQRQAQDGKIRRLVWSSPALTHLFGRFVTLSYQVANDWMSRTQGKRRHIPLVSSSLTLGAKCACVTLLGDFYADDRIVGEFKRKADKYWAEVSGRLCDGAQISSRREKAIKESVEELHRVMRGHVQCWFEAENATPPSRWTLTDYLMDLALPQDDVVHELVHYFLVLLNVSGHLASWTLYNLAEHPEIHDDLAAELKKSMADHGADAMTRDVLDASPKLRRVLLETLRHVPVVTWASRYQDYPLPVGPHSVPPATLVLYELGQLCYDRDLWTKPQIFDPDRFSDPELEAVMSKLFPLPGSSSDVSAFPPFSFAFLVASVVVAELSTKFRFRVSDPADDVDPEQEVDASSSVPGSPVDLGFGGRGRATVPKDYRMLTTPTDEIWITVQPRS